MKAMKIVTTPSEVRAFTQALARDGKRLALVPTMGFLHEGHLSLMREGARRADVVAVSIFVNPSQFGPTEDFSRYPRDPDGDARKCASAGVSLLYMPESSTVYPPGYQTWVTVEELSRGLCGDRRPGHFRGVATVVAKLLALFRPDVAIFGEKDYQQLQVIRRLCADLEFGVEIVGMPTVREPDGLAMSSRNAYLDAGERQRAQALSRGLFAARDAAAKGEGDAAVLVGLVRAQLEQAAIREDYVALCHAESLEPLAVLEPGVPGRLLVAAFVGRTRLIDNVAIARG
jgi:pantoate--beta-alanine ligase